MKQAANLTVQTGANNFVVPDGFVLVPHGLRMFQVPTRIQVMGGITPATRGRRSRISSLLLAELWVLSRIQL